MPCTLRRSTVARAHHDGRLGPGRSAAPDDDRLVLLPSGPDTVRGSPLRGTRSSTSHRRAATENGDLERGFGPAGADCRLQGTASSPPSTAREGYPGRRWKCREPSYCLESMRSHQHVSPPRGRPRRRQSRGPERAYPRVRERGPQATTRASGVIAAGGCGGEGGIRTRDGLPQTAFPVRRHSPLGDLSRGGRVTGRDRSRTVAEPDPQRGTSARGTRAPERQPATRASEAKAPSEHRSARTRGCVSEEHRRQRGHRAPSRRAYVAERAGFEPAVLSHTAFRERHHQPLGHLSVEEDTKGGPDHLTAPRCWACQCQCRGCDERFGVAAKKGESDRQPRTFMAILSLAVTD